MHSTRDFPCSPAQAVIAFLETRGDLSAFWRVLSDNGITKEKLASYERKITMEPHLIQTDLHELTNDFRAYLSVIQDVHDARDARVSCMSAFSSRSSVLDPSSVSYK